MGEVLKSPIRCIKANVKRDKNSGKLYLEYYGEANLDSGDVAAIYREIKFGYWDIEMLSL